MQDNPPSNGLSAQELGFTHSQEGLQPGPYIAAEGTLWQVLRLYDDVQKAFLTVSL